MKSIDAALGFYDGQLGMSVSLRETVDAGEGARRDAAGGRAASSSCWSLRNPDSVIGEVHRETRRGSASRRAARCRISTRRSSVLRQAARAC